MKTGIKRKKKLPEFTIKEYGINAVLMSILFLFGLYLSWKLSTFAGMLYVMLCSAMYFVLYTGMIVLFFYVLFYHTGCPNCVQTKCPMNPDFNT